MKHIQPTNTMAYGGLFLLLILLSACGGSGGGEAGSNDAALPNLSLSGVSVTEGDAGAVDMAFVVTLDRPASNEIKVDYASSGVSASPVEDFIETAGTLTLAAGETQAMIMVEVVGDACFEDDESLLLNLSNPSPNVRLSNTSASGTINNDDSRSVLAIADASGAEGSLGAASLAFEVTLDKAACTDISVGYASSDITASAPGDYTAASGTVIIPAGSLSDTIDIALVADTLYEVDETLTVTLNGPSDNAELGDASAFGTIFNDDAPALRVSTPSIEEGADGALTAMTFVFSLDAPSDTVSLHYVTVDGDATTADGDYTFAEGDVVIAAGTTEASVTVVVNGDNRTEADETLHLQLSNLSGSAQLATTSASGIILNDDIATTAQGLSVHYAQVVEGAPNTTTTLVFPVTIDPPLASAISVNYTTVDGDAAAGSDYTAASGRINIAAGESSAEITVSVNGDDIEEDDETLQLEITSILGRVDLLTPSATGRIIDDDGVAGTALRINTGSASVYEGAPGEQTLLRFEVALSEAAATEVSVDYATGNDSAIAGSDYTGVAGSLKFPAGVVSLPVEVTVTGDDFVEADERFRLVLSNPTGAALNHADAFGSIISDDPFAGISIDDLSQVEGDDGSTVDMEFTVSLSVAAADPVTVDYAVRDQSTDANDYVATGGQLEIPAGSTTGTITVTVNGDNDIENDEKFTVALSMPSNNALLSDAEGAGTIMNDDGDGGWGVPELLEQDADNDARHPVLAMNAGGDAMALWPQNATPPEPSKLLSRRYVPGSGWQVDTEIANDGALVSSSNLGTRPLLVVDDNRNAVAVWLSSGSLVANQYTEANGWGVGTLHTLYDASRVDTDSVVIAGNASGQVAVAWLADNVNAFFDDVWAIRYDPVTGWDAQARRLEFNETEWDHEPQVAIDDNGNVMVVWSRHQPNAVSAQDIYYSRYDAAADNWSTADLAEVGQESAEAPNVVTFASGDALVLWDQDTATGAEIQARRYSAALGDWDGLPTALGTGHISSRLGIRAATNGAGDVFVAWHAGFSIYGARYDAAANAGAGGWDPERVLATDDVYAVELPEVAADDLGNAIAVWQQYGGTVFNVRSARFDALDDDWQPAETLEVNGVDNDGTSESPRVTMDANGNAIVVWHRVKWSDFWGAYVGNADVWTVRYTRP